MNTPVSFEIAKLLKERKQNIISSKLMYASSGKLTDAIYDFDNWCFAPTIAEVITWLYEKYGIWIVSLPITKNKWYFEILYNYKKDIGWVCMNDSTEFNSPTEAYEAAIEYTLKNLI